MAIPATIRIKNGELPDHPGVYFYYDAEGTLLYIGKATSLKKRVGSYFAKTQQNLRLFELVSRIARIEYTETPTVIEALVLEANQIRTNQPPYNILGKDDKSFLYLCITNEAFPRPLLLRGLDLERMGIQPFVKKLSPKAERLFSAVYGPYFSGRSLKRALELLRPAMPWSVCEPPTGTDGAPELAQLIKYAPSKGSKNGRPCFDAQIGKCPGVCTGTISKAEYSRVIRRLQNFFEGKKGDVIEDLRHSMEKASKAERFEEATKLRDNLYALEHVHDVSLIMREDDPIDAPSGSGFINANGRIEAYDIANISGTANVAAMTVFIGGKPAKQEYRRFKIKTVEGADDFSSMEEVIRRRLLRAIKNPNTWPLPEMMVIDGGEGQLGRVKKVMEEVGITVPAIGIAKGFDRKQDRIVYLDDNADVRRIVENFKPILQGVRDEAHRFAGAYHRLVRGKNSGIPVRRKKASAGS